MATQAKVSYKVVKLNSDATDAELNIDGQFCYTGDGFFHLGYGTGHTTYDCRSISKLIAFDDSVTTDAEAIAKAQELGTNLIYFNTTDGELRITKQNSTGSSYVETLVGSGVSSADLSKAVSQLELSIAQKANTVDVYSKTNTYSKTEITNLINTVQQSVPNAYTKDETDTLIEQEKDRALKAETTLQSEIDAKAKAAHYTKDTQYKQYDFVIYGNEIFLVTQAFTASGVFSNDQGNFVALQSNSDSLGVVTYTAGIEIKNGQTVIHNDGNTQELYICTDDIANTTTWDVDSAKMVSYGASINLDNYYNKQQTDALLATKMDTLQQGTGVKVDRTDNTITVSADMTTTADAEKLVQRDASGAAYAKALSTPTDDMLVPNSLLTTELDKKQNKLTAGNNITIDDNGVISSTATSSEKYDSGVHDGYSLYTIFIDESKAYVDPATAITTANDAVGKTRDELTSFIGLYPCLTNEGAEIGKLNPNDYTKVISGYGTTSTVGVDAMVCFPKRGIKFTKTSNVIRIDFTDDPDATGFDYSAFMQSNTKIQSAFYYGVYEGYALNSKLYSVRGFTPTVNATIGTFRNWAKARQTSAATSAGRLYTIQTWHMWKYIQACYCLIYQNLNSQTLIGYGRHSGGSVCSTGGSDTWGIHSQNIPSASKTSGTTNIKCLGIEDLWGNCWDWTDGLVTRGYRVCTSVNVANFNDYGYGYNPQGICYNGNVDGSYITSVAGTNELGFYPTDFNGGSQTKSYCDCFWQGSNCVATSGGGWNDGFGDGVFTLAVDNAASNADSNNGARLCLI